MSMKKTTTMVVVRPQTNKKKKNKTRSKAKKNGSSTILGQERSAPIAKTIQTSVKMNVRNFRFPKRSEMITTVLGSASEYEVQKAIILNPGDNSFSTWLSNIARCFESYRFHSLRFFYIPRCPSTSTGDVIMSPDMNPRDDPPQNEIQASQNELTKSSASWDKISISLSNEMLAKRRSYFCRKEGGLAVNADKDLYDTGNLFLIVGGQGNTNKIGQLWVEYEVEFFTPESSQGSGKTLFSRNDNGLVNSSPIVGNTATRVTEQVGEFVEQIVNVTGQWDDITFKKDFHGILNLNINGAGINAGATPLTTNTPDKVTITNSDNGFNVGNILANSAGVDIVKIIDAKAGGRIQAALAGSTSLINSVLSMTNCYL
jgi:hypothetical protein